MAWFIWMAMRHETLPELVSAGRDTLFVAGLIRDGAYVLALCLVISFLADKHIKALQLAQEAREKDLSEARDRLQLAADAAELGVWEWNLTTDLLTWDKRMFEIYRMVPTPDMTVDYKTWAARVHPVDIPAQNDSFRGTLANGRSTRDFRILLGETDEVRHLSSAAMVIHNNDGVAVRVVGVNRDVTDQKRSATEIEKSESWYRQLFANTNDAVFVRRFGSTGQNTPFLAVNDIACRRLGYTRGELLKLTPADIDDAEQRTIHPGAMRRVRADRQHAWDGVHVASDGRKLPVHINSRLASIDGDTYLITAVRDMALIEQKVCELPVDLHDIIDQVDRPVVTLDERGGILFANRAMQDLTGYSRSGLIGQNWFQLLSAPRSQENVQYAEAILVGKIAPTETLSILAKDGRVLPFPCVNSLRKDARGRVIGLSRIGSGNEVV
jgi:PAS domain S-box-containing protein